MTTATDTHLPSATDARALRTGVFSDPDIWPATGALDRPALPGLAGEVTGLSVLVVDDDPVRAETLADLLWDGGHTAATAYSPPAAIAAARRNRRDAILIAVAAPGFDGFALGRQLLGGGPSRPTLIAVSGGDGQEARAEGFDHHVREPADAAALLRVLAAGSTGGAATSPRSGRQS